jgi:putative MATE family efflux protein
MALRSAEAVEDRRRVVTWQDPKAAARAGREMAGLDYLQAMVEGRLPPPPIIQLLGIRMVSVEPGRVRMDLPVGEYLYNPLGSVHGGAIATILDSVMGCAVHSVQPKGRGYTTLEIKVNYLRAITDAVGPVTAEGRVVHAGPLERGRGRDARRRRREALRDGEHDLPCSRPAGAAGRGGMSAAVAAPAAPAEPLAPRTRMLLEAPVLPTLLRLAWPNVLVMGAQAATGLIETYWIGKLGTDALAGVALVFPGLMLMQMMSAGALGGGISAAIARALGGGRRDDADALLRHAILLNAAIGFAIAGLALAFGRPLYRALGAEGAALDAAVIYSNVVFTGIPLLWLMNGVASAIRGTGNMLVPAVVICAGAALLVPLSPLLIFGFGPLPGLGIAGGGAALVLFNAGGLLALVWYVGTGRSLVRFRSGPIRREPASDILRVGAWALISPLQTTVTIALSTAMAGSAVGAAGLAGFGTAARIEYLLIPIVFGLGAPLVAMVGANLGAGRRDRAVAVAWTGGAAAFALTEAIGVAAAIWPESFMSQFGQDPAMIATGAAFLRAVGPVYGFFGLGLALYFASQGAGRLLWPLVAGFIRMAVAVGAGYLVLRLTGSLDALFAVLALAIVLYGLTVATAIWRGVWFDAPRRTRATVAPAAAPS